MATNSGRFFQEEAKLTIDRPSHSTGADRRAEGVDFIETEEDAEAVESAVVKIQSTFRGKKIRSKLGQKQAAGAASKQPQGSAAEQASRVEPRQEEEAERAASAASKTSAADKSEPAEGEQHEELGGRLSRMQVNDNSSANKGPQNVSSGREPIGAPPSWLAAAAARALRRWNRIGSSLLAG